ncbi:dihydropteroate synthase [Gammaproteobacteria bacterium 53_120_T64]|nr:dihydropteroate synthase [Gammaproteobacteria bacterium 53_120_T64]
MGLLDSLTQRGRPLVMGILNLTPDSFSDGGELFRDGELDLDKVYRRVQQLLEEGVDLLDLGGESTRPGADKVEPGAEMARVLPALEALQRRFDLPLSVDTSSPELMLEAAQSGAAMLNDVRALRRPGALQAVAASGLPVCLMHTLDEPKVMQDKPQYDDVVADVGAFLRGRIEACEKAGIPRARLVVDPGFGFGKSLAQNLSLFRALPALVAEGLPVMVGVSRKSMIGEILNKPVEQRVFGSAALAVLASQAGVGIIRVHDVAATVDSLKILEAVQS